MHLKAYINLQGNVKYLSYILSGISNDPNNHFLLIDSSVFDYELQMFSYISSNDHMWFPRFQVSESLYNLLGFTQESNKIS